MIFFWCVIISRLNAGEQFTFFCKNQKKVAEVKEKLRKLDKKNSNKIMIIKILVIILMIMITKRKRMNTIDDLNNIDNNYKTDDDRHVLTNMYTYTNEPSTHTVTSKILQAYKSFPSRLSADDNSIL